MLTTTTRHITNLGLGGIYVAHVIRTEDETGKYHYVLGISLGNGQPIGIITHQNASRLRSFVRLSAVEDFVAVLKPNLVMLNVYPADGPIQRVKDNLIESYRLDNPIIGNITLETERRDLLAVLSQGQASTDGRNQDTPNP